VRSYNLPAEKAAPLILEQLRATRSVHLALLDPFSIGVLPFAMVKAFASHPKVDVVVNYGLHDVQRNLLKNLRGEAGEMDAFCPGWREAVAGVNGKRAQRGRVLERWLHMVEQTGAKYSREMPLVRDARRRIPLYYLVFAAHHEGPIRVWGDIAKDGQRDLF
jgi:three-Cys-motif partner protein